jgi:DNA-binding transcriptional LysR family regulator
MAKLINFELFDAVEVLSEATSYRQAAHRLGITPALLKSRVAALEEQLGFHVFQPQTDRVMVTPEGKALITAARVFLNEAKRIKTRRQAE